MYIAALLSSVLKPAENILQLTTIEKINLAKNETLAVVQWQFLFLRGKIHVQNPH